MNESQDHQSNNLNPNVHYLILFFTQLDSVEICRVCRSEGTSEQPLFYPCLCSGSIKYIHQDCLIEWLKHSRKKYCELCKHPFTFSPVYAEQMPQSIPVSVLVWGLVKKVLHFGKVGFSLSFSAFLWLLIVPLLTTQIFRYYFGWNLHEVLHSAFAIQDLNDNFLETSLMVAFDVIQGFLMTGFTVFLILAMLLVREFLIMIGYDPSRRNRTNSIVDNANVESTNNNNTNNTADNVSHNIASTSSNSESMESNIPAFTSSESNALPSVNSLRSPLSPTSQLVSPLSPIRRHSEFRNGTNPTSPGSPVGNYWVEQAHPKEFRNYMKRRDLQRALMEAEQGHRPFDVESYLNDNEAEPLIQPEDHVSNISGTSTLRSRFTTATNNTNTTNMTNSSSRESFRCRICSSNTCTSREHVIQASHMRNTLTAQRNQAILQRAAQVPPTEPTNPTNNANATNPANTQANPTANTNEFGWNLDAAESISFPEFFGFTLEGTPLLQLLQNSAIVIGCNALFMHLFLFIPFVTGKVFSNESVFSYLFQFPVFEYTKFTWKYFALLRVEKDSFAEFVRNVIIGYSILCSACSVYLRCTRKLRDSFHLTINPIFSFICVFIKLLTLLFTEMVLFPLASGFLVDYFCLDLFPGTLFYSRLAAVRTLPISSLTIHWALGAFFMLSFASFVTFSRSFLRPGLLYFLRNPQDPDSNPVKEMVERSFPDQVYRLAISLIFYATLIYSSIGIVVQIITIPSVSKLIFPLNFKFHEPLIEIPIDLLFHLLLRSLVTSFSPLKLFKAVHISLQKILFRHMNLSSYFLGGGRYLSEESFPKGGNWVAVPDYDRIYSRKRLSEIRSRVITPVDIAKLKILYDRQNQPVLDTSTSNSHSHSTNSRSDWTVVFRPNYFKLKCFTVLLVTLLSLQMFLLSISIGPLLAGRFIVKFTQETFYSMNSGNAEDIHEIYSWHIGAFGLFLLLKLIEFFVIPIKKQRRRSIENNINNNGQLSEKISLLLGSFFKIAVLTFFLVLLWPLQVGILFSLLINPLLLDNSTEFIGSLVMKESGNTLQLPLLFFGTCWSVGFPILRILYSFKTHLPLSQQTITYLRINRNSLDQIELKQFLRLVALPVTFLFTFSIVFPPFACLILVPLCLGPSASINTVISYQNSSHLVSLLIFLTLKILRQIVSIVGKIVSGIRDETYLVGRRLHNLENRSSSNSTNNTNNNNNMSPLM